MCGSKFQIGVHEKDLRELFITFLSIKKLDLNISDVWLDRICHTDRRDHPQQVHNFNRNTLIRWSTRIL